MCGIFGIVANDQSTFSRPLINKALNKMFLLSQSRGKDASGIAFIEYHHIDIIKRPIRAAKLMKHPEFIKIQDKILNSKIKHSIGAIGHARMVTNGSAFEHSNNQPIVRNGIVCVHNGIIVNDSDIWQTNPDLVREFEVDTEIFVCLIHKYLQEGNAFLKACQLALKPMLGANSFAIVSGEHQKIALSSTNGSLYVSFSQSKNEMIFSSEEFILNQAIASLNSDEFSGTEVEQLQCGQIIEFSLSESNKADSQVTIADMKPEEFEFKDYQNPYKSVAAKNVSADKAMLTIDFERIGRLKRCSKCILPETFPFIKFASDGTCNYCLNWQKPALKKLTDLEDYVAQANTYSDGRYDCLVPISGGRDSCYGLHYIKKELGLRPVAFTYDWGMVTDLARRNISRMCGALEVEHILISADIKAKRENIRKNILAWLKRPNLGTVPLFMAGDKQFFYFANLLKKQMNVGATIFSMNPMERTDFKVGFCGIDENFGKEKHYNLHLVNQLRMLKYYGLEFVKNPSYLNKSVFDSMFAFASYYLIEKDYVSIFDFLPWNEKNIEGTLISSYDWEISPESKSTWRIGDGTAAFYNYIYCRVAGFSENDTLRSNLIRNGNISRVEALRVIDVENAPKFKSFQWYCSTVGIEYKSAVQAINNIKQLY